MAEETVAMANENKTQEEFAKADKNQDGFLSMDEIREMLDMQDQEEVEKLMKTLDTNNDGKVSYAGNILLQCAEAKFVYFEFSPQM